MIKIFCRLLIFSVGCISSTALFAGVYRCMGQNGQVEFRDHPCQSSMEKQDFLPYVYQKTDKKIVAQKEKELKKVQKRLIVEEKRQVRANARQKKVVEKEALKTKRRLERCSKTQEKIKLIEKKLEFGCKVRRCDDLRKQLIHCEKMKHKYCNPG